MALTTMHWGLLTAKLIFLFHPAFPGSDMVKSFQSIVKITCKYTIHNKVYSMCWGRGPCPLSRCSDEIIWTNGSRVTWRKSDRYQLMGDIEKGDVTLTISRVTMEDRGTYCCRVEVPRLFNDLKMERIVDEEHIHDDEDDDMDGLRVALVYVSQESVLPHPKITHKENEKMSQELNFGATEPEVTWLDMPLVTESSSTGEKITSPPDSDVEEMIEKSNIPTIIRVTVLFLLLLIYSCIMKVNKRGQSLNV